ncbi:MAG: hypothetical protein LBF86_00555 [Helicobacteraceae bacterium]|jgi:hypothetical protein|nr:hypothetical protein [Helicobacteraceae bacterium]
MKTLKSLTIAALSALIIGCGDSGGGSDSPKKYVPPPDPSEAGKATLEGIDSNNNGIRDDIEIAIYEYKPKPEQLKERQSLIQSAKAYQAAILAGDSKDEAAITQASKATMRIISCKRETYIGDDRKDINKRLAMEEDSAFLQIAAFNTKERKKAYWEYNQALSGRILSLYDGDNPCDYIGD